MRIGALLLIAALVGCKSSGGEDSASQPAVSRASPPAVSRAEPQKAEPSSAPGYYLGRKVASYMSHEGAEWLTRPEREAEEKTSRMLKELRLEPGDVACDLGAGNGYHTLAMAKAVAPKGRAIGVDIQPEMLELLQQRAKKQGVANVETILGGESDPKLPDATCDLILLADVYHELAEPAAMLQHLGDALTPTGEIVLLEFRGEDPEVPIKPLHKMTKKQMLRELEANGFELSRSFEELPWQHLMFFVRRGAPSPN